MNKNFPGDLRFLNQMFVYAYLYIYYSHRDVYLYFIGKAVQHFFVLSVHYFIFFSATYFPMCIHSGRPSSVQDTEVLTRSCVNTLWGKERARF